MSVGTIVRSLCVSAALIPGTTALAQTAAQVFADFEGADYGPWKTTGTAFGAGPAAGTLPGQMPVDGFQGHRLVNSFLGGDGAIGTLTSPEFPIQKRYIGFLIGGGGFQGKTCLNLLVDGRDVRTATGPNTEPGGSEALTPKSWDVRDLLGKTARLQVVDEATGGWGHINVDQIIFTDLKPAVDVTNPTRDLTAERRYLNIPVKKGARKRQLTVAVDGRTERRFEIELAEDRPDWWANLEISAWKGKTLTIQVDRLPEDSPALGSLTQGDTIKEAEDIYREPLRPQFHFSARRGWLNDPNGLVAFEGEYHLFFQHNPYGWDWGNMHWGHAVGRDLVRWEELDEALYPDDLGAMFSGSAVVDRENTSGLGRDGKPPIVLIYTAAGRDVQCLASSTDRGRTWTKFDRNPVVKTITPGNRDPKVFWHPPTRRWVMALYVGLPSPTAKDAQGNPATTHTIHFLTSPNLRDWTLSGRVEGFFECPDLFELPLDGDPARTKWVLTAASSEYMVGRFDGSTFRPETPKLPGHRGRNFYAAQTFSDIPPEDGRRIQFGWLTAPSPGMPFNQAMSVPLVLSLRSTPDGPRLARQPAKELESLRESSHTIPPASLDPGDDPLMKRSVVLADIRLEFEPGSAAEVSLRVRGIPVVYDARKQEILVNGHRAPAPLLDGKQRVTILLDRTSIEVFASDGLTYVPIAVIARDDDRSLSLTAHGGTARITKLDVHEMGSAWTPRK